MVDFSPLEISLIKSSLESKTDEQLAELLERPMDEIRTLIDLITEGQGSDRNQKVRSEQLEKAINKKKRKKPVPVQPLTFEQTVKLEQKTKKDRKLKEMRERVNAEETRKVKRDKSEHRRKYKTIKVDYTQLVSVRIDSKTTVLAKPGTDIEWLKKQYKRKPIGPGDIID